MPRQLLRPTMLLALHLIASGLTGVGAFVLSERQQPGSGGETTEADDLCFPTNSADFPDLNAPCNVFSRIQQLCVYGEKVREQIDSPGLISYDASQAALKEVSPELQRDCICQSQQFDQTQGCMACYNAHDVSDQAFYQANAVEFFSSSYCAAETTPTIGYPTAIAALLTYSGEIGAPTSTISGANARRTDVSLYFTPAVTGSEAWDPDLPTSTASEGPAMETGKVDRGMTMGLLGFAALVAGL